MATVTKRINGQLQETDDINDQAALAGVPVTPATPAGGAAIGANPDQSKMLGSSANKQAVIEEAVKPADTLQTAQRVAAPTAEANAAQEQARVKAAQINSLGSLHTRVESMVQGQLAGLQAPTGSLNQVAIDALPVEKREQASTLLNAVIANPNDPAALAAATQYFKDNGLATGENFNPQDFIATAQDSLGKAAADQVANEVKVGGLPLEAAESESLDEIFGEGWREWTVPQLAQKIEDQKQAQFSTVSGLQAELKTATGNQRQMILKQLEDLGQVGATGTEATVADIAKQVDSADEVKIGEDTYKVGDLLKDEEISKLVTKMLADPKLAEQVAKTNPEFAAWVKSNAEGLSELAKTVEATQGTVRTADVENAKVAEVGGVTLNDDVMTALIPDWGKTTGAAYDTSTSGILGYLKDPNLDPAKATSIANALQAASSDPALLRTLSGLTAEQFGYAYDLAQAVDADTTGLLSQLTGVDPTTGFVLPDQQASFVKFKAITEAITRNVPADAEAAKAYNIAINDPMLMEAIKGSSFSAKDARLLGEHPERWEEYKTAIDINKRMDAAVKGGDIDSALQIMFGTENVDAATVNAEYENVKRTLAIDPTDKEAQAKLNAYQKLDSNADGIFDSKDLAHIQAKLTKDVTEGAATFDLRAALTGGSKQDGAAQYQAMKVHEPSGANLYVDSVSKLLKDDKLTLAEVMSLPADMQTRLLGNKDLMKKHGINVNDIATAKKGNSIAKVRKDFNTAFTALMPMPKGIAVAPDAVRNVMYDMVNNSGATTKANEIIASATGQRDLYAKGTVEYDYWNQLIGGLTKGRDNAMKKVKERQYAKDRADKAARDAEDQVKKDNKANQIGYKLEEGQSIIDGVKYYSSIPSGGNTDSYAYVKGKGWVKKY